MDTKRTSRSSELELEEMEKEKVKRDGVEGYRVEGKSAVISLSSEF